MSSISSSESVESTTVASTPRGLCFVFGIVSARSLFSLSSSDDPLAGNFPIATGLCFGVKIFNDGSAALRYSSTIPAGAALT